jgi:CDP-glycerol glycerophosphotransferase (TagB/SpsB family)
MPTFRNSQSAGNYDFSAEELRWLGDWLEQTGTVLGVREHMADTARGYGRQFAGLPTVDLSDAIYPNVEVLYRLAEALITDYSSAFIDYMLTGRPAVSFAYDYEAYQLERGGFYDLDQIFPGPICKTFDELKQALLGLSDGATDPVYEFKRRLFFDHLDDDNAARVVERLRNLSEIHGLGKWPGERTA